MRAELTSEYSTQAPYEVPDDRSQVQITVFDAATRKELPWAVVEVHPLGLAAQKLRATYAPNAHTRTCGLVCMLDVMGKRFPSL
jgi:hypothetical protein